MIRHAVVGVIALGCTLLLAACSSDPSGTIVFGTKINPGDVTVQGQTTSFARSSPFAFVAYLSSQAGSTTVVVTITGRVGHTNLSVQTQSVKIPSSGDTVIGAKYDVSALAPGHYSMQVRGGSNTLARGDFTITG